MDIQVFKTVWLRNRGNSQTLLSAQPFVPQKREDRVVCEMTELIKGAFSQHALFLEPEALDQSDRPLVPRHDEGLNPIQLHLSEAEIDDCLHRLGHDALAPVFFVEAISHLSLIVGGWRPFVDAYRANRFSMALERDHPAKAHPLLV